MKAILLVCFSVISISASAQWLGFSKHERFPQLNQVKDNSFKRFEKVALSKPVKLKRSVLSPSEYNLEANENSVMKSAQHNMRFRIYDLASYNFSELAQLYIMQNRFSEAKWYFLQSNNISRRNSNDKLTIANLINLADVKSQIGDFMLAQDDLFEARDMASAHGWLGDVISIEKKLKSIQYKRVAGSQPQLRYASNVKLNTQTVN